MSILVGIDVGGTFTDCVALDVVTGRTTATKVPTTQYDLQVGFTRALERVAELKGLDMERFLKACEAVIYSSTQETNTLIERKGATLGLITTRGFEDTVFIQRGKGSVDGLEGAAYKRQCRKLKPVPYLPRDMIVGIPERIDCLGKVQIPLHEEEVRDAVIELVDRGAEGFVVCLLQSIRNNIHERKIKEIIKREFPPHRLGSVPVVLSSEVSPSYREYPRMNTAIMTAYLQGQSAELLKNLQEKIAGKGPRPLLIMQNFGGASKVNKSTAVSCLGSGPVAGSVHGRFLHSHYSERFGTKDAIFTDIGGTSFDLSLLIEGELQTAFEPIIDRFRIQTPMVRVMSIGAGGGTIAKIDPATGRLDMGPESAGAMPGPACYGLGGEDPTVTDADVVLGRINPDYYLGGEMALDVDLAREAIEDRIAKPLGIQVEEAALRIVRLIDNKMANLIEKEVTLKGRHLKELPLYAWGGAGATHCCGFSEVLKPKAIIVPLQASVFSGNGAAISDIYHKYWRSCRLDLWGMQRGYASDYTALNEVCANMEAEAAMDMKSEGFEEGQYQLQFEYEMKYGPMLWELRVPIPLQRIRNEEDAQVVKEVFTREYVKEFGEHSKYESGGIVIEGVILTAVGQIAPVRMEPREVIGKDPSRGLEGARPVVFDSSGAVETSIYRLERLASGNRIAGPAIIEAPDTTYVIPPGRKIELDQFMNGIIEEVV
jgi:N-methylhydantoinase A/acetophenone carboxylase